MQLIKLCSVQKEGGREREAMRIWNQHFTQGNEYEESMEWKESYKDNTGWFSYCIYAPGELLIPFKSEYALVLDKHQAKRNATYL